MDADFGQVTEGLRRSTVQVYTGGRGPARGSGSGVIWDANGLIVTNAHVARDAHPRVELWDGRSFAAQVEARDPRRDLASLRIPAGGLPSAMPGDSAAVRVGELVLAVGNPWGFAGALTTGVVHAVTRRWVRADVRLAPGNSGGPLADARGRVIGINTMIAGGLALAVPSNTVTRFLRYGAEGIGLGVVVRPVRGGVLVLGVEPGSPAARSAIMVGDLLLCTLEQLHASVEAARGGVLRIEFLRGDRRLRREAHVRLEAPAAEAA